MNYNNPILTGFYPDPSICKVEDDYYIVNSSFEYFPGIPVFHSKNLINWKQIGHCITRNNQLILKKGHPNGAGLYAPTIRYNNGVFYVICTNVTLGEEDEGNFFVWTKDPAGEWSDPIWIDCPGIDPSLYFSEDGKVYYTGSYQGIIFCEIDIKTGKILAPPKKIWEGSGGSYPEGPHIYYINNRYYLLISEGGTEYGHMLTVARSCYIEGPYEAYPNNPILTNRSQKLEIKAVGHGDIICDQTGQWWMVCLGIRTLSYPFKHNLGRETMLTPMSWSEDGWPVFEDGNLNMVNDTRGINKDMNQIKTLHKIDEFKNHELDLCWNYIYNPIESLYHIGEDGLILHGNEVDLSQSKSLSWVGRRQQHHQCKVRTKMSFTPIEDGDEAGLTIYMNNKHHYEIALLRIDGLNYIIVRRQIGNLRAVEHKVLCSEETIVFEIAATKESYRLSYKAKNNFTELGCGETSYLTTEVGGYFTGNYFGLYATGNGHKCQKEAIFHWFSYISEGK